MKPRPVRFDPDPLDFAQVAFGSGGETFKAELVALIYDESPMNGCSLVLFEDNRLVEGALCVVKAGRMDAVAARIVWSKTVLPKMLHIGIQYLE